MYQAFSRQHFEELEEHLAVAQVRVEVADAVADSNQVRVDPFLKRLLLHTLALICSNKTKKTGSSRKQTMAALDSLRERDKQNGKIPNKKH